MKKFLSVLLFAAMITASCFAFGACEKKSNDGTNAAGADTEDDVVDGGWGKAASPEVSEKVKALFEKASSGMDGAVYVPVAYLESQIVAGTNHLVLCTVAPGVPEDPKQIYAIVTLYEDLEGGAEITSVRNSDAEAYFPTCTTGGWTEAGSPTLTDEAKTALAKACETLAGVEYTPVALLSTQLVSGMNYRILCEARATVPGAASEYVILTVYADLQGNAKITETYEFNVEENTQLANPVEEYGMSADSLEKAQEAVGFEIALPGSIAAENYIVINGEILEIDFDGGYIRKAKGSDDVSGDYNDYEDVKTADVNGRNVTLKGNDDKIMLAIWADGAYTYCISVANGVAEAEMTSYVDAIK